MDFSTPRWPVPFRLLSGTAGKEVRKDDVILSSYCGKSVQFNHSGESMSQGCPVCAEMGSSKNQDRWIAGDSDCGLYQMGNIALPGYLVLAPRRHVVRWTELERSERESLERFRGVVEEMLLGTEVIRKVYFLSFGEVCPHLHIHCFPRTIWMADDHSEAGGVDGAAVFVHYRKALACSGTPEEVLAMVRRLRNAFSERRSSQK